MRNTIIKNKDTDAMNRTNPKSTLPTSNLIAALRGAGDLSTGAALRLYHAGFRVVMTELSAPLCIRRTVAFAEAAFTGTTEVESVRARTVPNAEMAERTWKDGEIPLLIDPDLREVRRLHPDVLVDARLMKSWREDTKIGDAPLVIGLGPGFRAGANVDCVIETNRGHNLGRVFWQGEAEPNTGVPGLIRGEGAARVLKAPADGIFAALVEIGDAVEAGQRIAEIHDPATGERRAAIAASLTGIVRGVLHPGLPVRTGLKVMDIDPRGNPAHCFTVSDKALSVAGGVLEAILTRFKGENPILIA